MGWLRQPEEEKRFGPWASPTKDKKRGLGWLASPTGERHRRERSGLWPHMKRPYFLFEKRK
jgi:hypothetical protein